MNLPAITKRPQISEQAIAISRDRRYWQDTPPELVGDARWAATQAVLDLNAYLTPSDARWLSGRVETMLAHYWTPDLPEQLATAVKLDWLTHLKRFPQWAVDRVVQDWLATQRRKPTISDICDGCHLLIQPHVGRRDKLQHVLDVTKGDRHEETPDTPEQKAAALKVYQDAINAMKG